MSAQICLKRDWEECRAAKSGVELCVDSLSSPFLANQTLATLMRLINLLNASKP